jgi:hypothetical protein
MQTLAQAILAEDISSVYGMLQAGAEVNAIDEYGFTPLIESCIVDNVQIGELLLQQGANANVVDMIGNTALHWVVENNNLAFAKLLLTHGADANAYNFAGQPLLVIALLRQRVELKKLLLHYGADLDFAQDYINAKLLGHMFELVGTVDIVTPKNEFAEVDFEGFILEFSLATISESLAEFNNHFAGRQIRRYLSLTQTIIDALTHAAQLIKFQQYRTDLSKHNQTIAKLIQNEPLIIPVGYEGHAITFIKVGDILVKCDRREDSRLYDNIVFYRMRRPELLTAEFVTRTIFVKTSDEFVNQELPQLLDLVPLTELKVAAQISGNCSWANVEACIPALYFLLFSQAEDFDNNMVTYKNLALSFFRQWRDWNKERTLQFLIQSFHSADFLRKATKAEILAVILFQTCSEENPADHDRIKAILAILNTPRYEYILKNYIRSYCYEDSSERGKTFLQMLRNFGFSQN